jgi:hypothetical protein
MLEDSLGFFLVIPEAVGGGILFKDGELFFFDT